MNLTTTVVAMNGGVSALAGAGMDYLLTVGGNWAAGETWQLLTTDNVSGSQVEIGSGTMSGVAPTYCFTFNQKAYFLAGTTLYFSALNDPAKLNDINGTGNGFIELSNNFGTSEPLQAMAVYQGRLAVMSRRTTQIWTVDPDPANYQQTQVLPNVGTAAPDSVKAVGDMDVYLLMDSGVRSIRVRDASNNAILADIGTPIDGILQKVLATLTEAEVASSCAVVEPSSNRYWLFIPGHNGAEGRIYVFSYFPSSQITAWSTYRPTYTAGGVQTVFAPEKFVTLNGRVYVRAGNKLLLYGGADNQTYDACGVTADTPFLHAKTPGTRKAYTGIDAACEGTWTVSLGVDTADPDSVKAIYQNTGDSFKRGLSLATRQGTHFKLRLEENGNGYARFSSAIVHYQGGDEK